MPPVSSPVRPGRRGAPHRWHPSGCGHGIADTALLAWLAAQGGVPAPDGVSPGPGADDTGGRPSTIRVDHTGPNGWSLLDSGRMGVM